MEINEDEVKAEIKKTTGTVCQVNKNLPTSIEDPWYAKQFSSFSSCVRLVGWIRRFIDKRLKKSTAKGEFLSKKEIARAELEMLDGAGFQGKL